MTQRPENETTNDSGNLPAPGPQKRDPEKVDRLLDEALEDTMLTSDPPQITQPDVRIKDKQEKDGDVNKK